VAVVSPPAEVDIDEGLVRSLLTEQHPDLDHLPLAAENSGWDNSLWRLGDRLVVRLPRRAMAAQLALNEHRWLPVLAPRLPLPVPSPLRVGGPSGNYPWSWSIVTWMDGLPGDIGAISDPDDAGHRLGRFLRALHEPAPRAAPHNPFRSVSLEQRTEIFEDHLIELSTEIDVGATRRVWDRACTAGAWLGPRSWLHGDLHPANTLVVDGTLGAVLDFGDICGGDPATDLAGAWMLLPISSMPSFIDAYGGLDTDLEHRSLGWAVLFGLFQLAMGLHDKPTYAAIGRSTLAKAIEQAM